MSKKTEQIFKAFNKYLEEQSDDNLRDMDLERLMSEFMLQYDNDLDLITETAPETSDEYFELALEANSDKEALKYAKKALSLDPHNFDAKAMIIELKAKDLTELVKNYERAVQEATKYMKEEGYFDESYIGAFWGILETRPYMRLRAKFLRELISCGKIGQAREECEELLRLCDGDNLGIRYSLMYIYAYFEDEDAALVLHKRFEANGMLLPLSILYYKKGNYSKSAKYLRQLNSENKDLKQFLRIITEDRFEEFEGFEIERGYRPGTIEELMVEFYDNFFIFGTIGAYAEWAVRQTDKLE